MYCELIDQRHAFLTAVKCVIARRPLRYLFVNVVPRAPSTIQTATCWSRRQSAFHHGSTPSTVNALRHIKNVCRSESRWVRTAATRSFAERAPGNSRAFHSSAALGTGDKGRQSFIAAIKCTGRKPRTSAKQRHSTEVVAKIRRRLYPNNWNRQKYSLQHLSFVQSDRGS